MATNAAATAAAGGETTPDVMNDPGRTEVAKKTSPWHWDKRREEIFFTGTCPVDFRVKNNTLERVHEAYEYVLGELNKLKQNPGDKIGHREFKMFAHGTALTWDSFGVFLDAVGQEENGLTVVWMAWQILEIRKKLQTRQTPTDGERIASLEERIAQMRKTITELGGDAIPDIQNTQNKKLAAANKKLAEANKKLIEEKMMLEAKIKKLTEYNAALFASHNAFSSVCFNCGKDAQTLSQTLSEPLSKTLSEPLSKTLSKCAKCKIAQYCSKDCQQAHWKAGHNKACTALIQQQQQLMSNFRFQAQAEELGKRLDAMQSNTVPIEDHEALLLQVLNLEKSIEDKTNVAEKWYENCLEHEKKIEARDAQIEKLEEANTEKDKQIAALKASAGDEGQNECQICFEGPKDTALDPCGHRVCHKCAFRFVNSKKCPTCSGKVVKSLFLF